MTRAGHCVCGTIQEVHQQNSTTWKQSTQLAQNPLGLVPKPRTDLLWHAPCKNKRQMASRGWCMNTPTIWCPVSPQILALAQGSPPTTCTLLEVMHKGAGPTTRTGHLGHGDAIQQNLMLSNGSLKVGGNENWGALLECQGP